VTDVQQRYTIDAPHRGLAIFYACATLFFVGAAIVTTPAWPDRLSGLVFLPLWGVLVILFGHRSWTYASKGRRVQVSDLGVRVPRWWIGTKVYPWEVVDRFEARIYWLYWKRRALYMHRSDRRRVTLVDSYRMGSDLEGAVKWLNLMIEKHRSVESAPDRPD
jgi:hypothetical protein